MHRDTGLYPIQNPAPPLTLATMWAVTDFAEENGATRFVPGSHRWPDGRIPAPDEIAAAEMPAGSLMIYVGSMIHGGGANRAKRPLVAVSRFTTPSAGCARRRTSISPYPWRRRGASPGNCSA